MNIDFTKPQLAAIKAEASARNQDASKEDELTPEALVALEINHLVNGWLADQKREQIAELMPYGEKLLAASANKQAAILAQIDAL